jgi:AsmA protein
VRAAVKVAAGRLDVSPMSAQLYQGTLSGSLSAQAADNPMFAVRQTLNGVAIGPLLRDAAQIDTLEGKGTVQADLTTRGATVQALKKALNGTAAVNLADGAVKGINIAGTIRSVRSKLGELRGQPVQSSDNSEKTDFTELKASFKVANGVARNNDLAMKSPLLRLEGAGDIDIGEDRLDYLLKATLVATSKGQGGRDAADLAGVTVPVKLTGALASPQWTIDFASMASDFAEKRLKDEVLKRIPGSARQPDSGGGIGGTIKDGLKGIFGR